MPKVLGRDETERELIARWEIMKAADRPDPTPHRRALMEALGMEVSDA